MWWSSTIASSPRLFACATSATELVPQSALMSRLAPASRSWLTAPTFSPYPSRKRSGRYGIVVAPSRSSASFSRAIEVTPSTSKSPNSAIVSRDSIASRVRRSAISMPGRSRGSCLPSRCGL